MRTVCIIGPGRAGRAFEHALAAAGWAVSIFGRQAGVRAAARDADLVLITTPDGAVGEVAAAIDPVPSTVVAHVAGSLGVDVLSPHPRRAAIHPLVSLVADPVRAGSRLAAGAWFAVAGDDLADAVVADLGGKVIRVADSDRAAYHAAACIASNHLVALLAQVERVAASAGVPLDAYLGLVRDTVENVAALGPRVALTGPVARGDWATVARHLEALEAGDRPAYEAMMREAARLAGREAEAQAEVPPCR